MRCRGRSYMTLLLLPEPQRQKVDLGQQQVAVQYPARAVASLLSLGLLQGMVNLPDCACQSLKPVQSHLTLHLCLLVHRHAASGYGVPCRFLADAAPEGTCIATASVTAKAGCPVCDINLRCQVYQQVKLLQKL